MGCLTTHSRPRLILHAPNVHNGGGLSLLNALLNVQPFVFYWVQLDKRLMNQISIPDTIQVRFVKKSITSRLVAEWKLKRYCQKEDIVVCLNGVPPLLPLPGKTIVLLQNCLLFAPKMISNFPWKKKIRLKIERYWLLWCQKHASRFIVQSNTMKSLAQKQLKAQAHITSFPFIHLIARNSCSPHKSLKYDFIYIANGEHHKNHYRLLESWRLLAEENIKPSLALTVNEDLYSELSQKISLYRNKFGLNVINLGCLSTTQVQSLYQTTKAMIYPSLGESLGLPLVEACSYGIPILAAERDYVRDVIEPIETFDPVSPLSMARSIKRFLKIDTPPIKFQTPKEFIMEIQS